MQDSETNLLQNLAHNHTMYYKISNFWRSDNTNILYAECKDIHFFIWRSQL